MLAEAIRDNELRVEYIGASVKSTIHINYVISAVFAGLAGGLTAITVGHIDPEMSYWTTSGEFVFITILSGTGSVFAPFVGAAIFETIRSFAYELSPNTWQMSLGLVMLIVIMFLPEGIWSLLKKKKKQMSKLLSTENITKKFGGVYAANNISVDIDELSVVGLIGSNGAGKTTFLNIITGYLKPDSGNVIFNQQTISNLSLERFRMKELVAPFKIPQLFTDLSVEKNLEIGVRIIEDLTPIKLIKKINYDKINELLDQFAFLNLPNQLPENCLKERESC